MKSNRELGLEVHKFLLSKGVETPLKDNPTKNDLFLQSKEGQESSKKEISLLFRQIMEKLNLDLTDDSLVDTPDRVAKMYVDEIFYGLDYSRFPKCTAVDNKMKYDEMVVVSDISVQSNCEHHFVVIDGLATVAYIPKDKVLGLSKINRIVEFFSKRPQIQERLTEQIFYSLCYILGTEDVAVTISATHYCVKSRGVRDESSFTTTSKIGGCFNQPEVRAEFYSLRKK